MDNKRVGKGATMYFPVEVRLSVCSGTADCKPEPAAPVSALRVGQCWQFFDQLAELESRLQAHAFQPPPLPGGANPTKAQDTLLDALAYGQLLRSTCCCCV
jgi:hypothetical protein